MKYVLVDNFGNVVNKKDLSDDIGARGARTYFKGIKNIDDEGFDKVWKIMVEDKRGRLRKIERIDYPTYIRWWEDEPTNLDDF